MGKLLILAVLGVAGFAVWKWTCSCKPPTAPNLGDIWWGPKHLEGKMDNTIRPFKINFTDEMVKDLKARLASHRPFTPPLEGINLEYGMNTQQLQEILDYWSKKYDFKARATFLNQFPQYKTSIQGLDIHFIRAVPEVKPGVTVVPILLLHGWPGSVREFYEMIPFLTKIRPDTDFVFEVIAPSLPGYGFSSPAVRPGLSPAHMGAIMRNLMQRLGHKTYYVQGGDWGSLIGSTMAVMYPNEVLGYHTNMAIVMNSCATLKMLLGAVVPSLVVDEKLADRMYPLGSFFAYLLQEFGYYHLQATKPDTIGVALSDSPSGIAAYILEKFATWTVRGSKKIPEHLSIDALIDNLMLYWVPNSITTSMRLYAEDSSRKYKELQIEIIKTEVPTWVTQAKHELFYQPPNILRTKYVNLLGATVLDDGGHFLALEKPQVLAEDVVTAVKAFRAWHREQKEKKTEL